MQINGPTPPLEPGGRPNDDVRLVAAERKQLAAAINDVGAAIQKNRVGGDVDVPKIIYNRMTGLSQLAGQKKEAVVTYLTNAVHALSAYDQTDAAGTIVDEALGQTVDTPGFDAVLGEIGQRGNIDKNFNAAGALTLLAYIDEAAFVDLASSITLKRSGEPHVSSRAVKSSAETLVNADPKKFNRTLSALADNLRSDPIVKSLAEGIDRWLNP